jgi:hypothetical protein
LRATVVDARGDAKAVEFCFMQPLGPDGAFRDQLGKLRRDKPWKASLSVRGMRPQESGFEESVQRGKRFVWILFGKKMTTLNRLEFHVYGLVLPDHRNVKERRRRW